MRYYSLKLTGASGSGSQVNATYTSETQDGKIDPGALNVEFDVTAFSFAAPVGAANVRLWGISLKTISQASDFNGATLELAAGMSKGLPLAKPDQRGTILKGTVFQAYGNWIETDMTLDLVVYTDGGATQDNPANIVVNWKKGDKLADALTQTLQTAYPGYQVNMNISDKLVLTQDETAHYQTIEQLGPYVSEVSQSIMNDPNYNGVDISLDTSKQTFNVFDFTADPSTIKQLAFEDMIGQPTWMGPSQIQVSCVLRADINVGDTIKFPPALATRTAAEQAQQPADQSAFTGNFNVNQVRHLGNFRAPDAASWITTINASAQQIANAATQPQNLG